MKYTNEIQINLPRVRVVELLDNAENMKYWMVDLISYKHLSQTPGQLGSRMEMQYLMGKRNCTMVETITEINFPERFSATYESKGMWNLVENTFTENLDGTTHWKSDSEFKFSGYMKVMAWFMPTSMLKKQSCKYLNDFKKFAESQGEEE